MRLISVVLACSAVGVSVPAFAQAIAVGTQVTDASGAPVGTVTAIQGANLMVKTNKHETLLPKASFTPSNGKLLIGMSQAQLNAAIEQSDAAAQASVAAGATAKGLAGTEIGKIESVTDSAVVIALPSGKKIQVDRKAVVGNVDGTVTVGLTAQQLDSQLQPSEPAAPKSE